MEIRLLGPVELWSGGRRIDLGSDKERLALAALALQANHAVGVDTLVGRLWEDADPPASAQQLYKPVSLLRGRLGSAGRGAGTPRIAHGRRTYTLQADPSIIDVNRYRKLNERGRALANAGQDAAACDVLAEAAGLWRGDPLTGLTGSWPDRVRLGLARAHRDADAARLAARLRLGRYGEVTPELTELVELHPDDQVFTVQLMLALYGSGQSLEANLVHRTARLRLASEFGLDPGAELGLVHSGILGQEPVERLVAATMGASRTAARPGGGAVPAADRPRGVADSGPDAPGDPAPPTARPGTARTAEVATTPAGASEPALHQTPPRSLPRQAPLIGRQTEVGELGDLIRTGLNGTAPAGAPGALAAITGMPGAGKTALAVTVARDFARHFPDGQIYLNLGSHLDEGPVPAGAALGRLLADIGVPAASVPPDTAARAALWRTRMADRRCLLLLDDAADPAHVLPLLPGGSPTFTIVTSRRSLAGLPASREFTVGVLTAADAVALFREFAGSRRTGDDAAVRRIVDLCGQLALAVELTAIRFRTRTAWDLAALAERLSRLPGRLGEIRDMNREMARAFEFSYLALTRGQRAAFRRLGLHPGQDFTVQDAQALLGADRETTERLLESLLACHLLHEPDIDRFRFHDLVREFAATRAYREERAEERERAVERLIAFYAAAADHAIRLLLPHRARMAPRPVDSGVRLPRWAGAHEARAWFAAERRNVASAESLARSHGNPEDAARIGHLLAAYLDSECHWAEAEVLHRRGVDHWARTGDRHALSQALIRLAGNLSDTAKYPAALEACERALETARSEQDRDTEAEALLVAGVVRWRLGDAHRAVAHERRALEIRTDVGTPYDRARCRTNLAIALLERNEFEEAEDHFVRALRIFHDAGDRKSETSILNNLGSLNDRKGDLRAAREYYEAALVRADAEGNSYARATTRSNLAAILGRSGDLAQALELHHRAIGDFRAIRDRRSLAKGLNSLGETYALAGRYDEAVDQHRSALDITGEIGAGSEMTDALRGLGRAELGRGSVDAAEHHLRSAMTFAHRTDSEDELALIQDALADVLVARGEWAEAVALLERAVGTMRRFDPFETGRMERHLADLRDRAGGTGGERTR